MIYSWIIASQVLTGCKKPHLRRDRGRERGCMAGTTVSMFFGINAHTVMGSRSGEKCGSLGCEVLILALGKDLPASKGRTEDPVM